VYHYFHLYPLHKEMTIDRAPFLFCFLIVREQIKIDRPQSNA